MIVVAKEYILNWSWNFFFRNFFESIDCNCSKTISFSPGTLLFREPSEEKRGKGPCLVIHMEEERGGVKAAEKVLAFSALQLDHLSNGVRWKKNIEISQTYFHNDKYMFCLRIDVAGGITREEKRHSSMLPSLGIA